jgi:hypothetical protein
MKTNTAEKYVVAYCKCEESTAVTEHIGKAIEAGEKHTCPVCKVQYSMSKNISPTIQLPTALRANNSTGKSAIVKAILLEMKNNGKTLDKVLEETALVAAKADLTSALAKTYIKNNWNKV